MRPLPLYVSHARAHHANVCMMRYCHPGMFVLVNTEGGARAGRGETSRRTAVEAVAPQMGQPCDQDV